MCLHCPMFWRHFRQLFVKFYLQNIGLLETKLFCISPILETRDTLRTLWEHIENKKHDVSWFGDTLETSCLQASSNTILETLWRHNQHPTVFWRHFGDIFLSPKVLFSAGYLTFLRFSLILKLTVCVFCIVYIIIIYVSSGIKLN